MKRITSLLLSTPVMKRTLFCFMIFHFSLFTASAQYTVLHNFNDTNGGTPYGALIASGSTLYGMTWWGGTGNGGVVFSIQTNGSAYTILHNFTGTDGGAPDGALTLSGSTLYGTTSAGGANDSGVIFSVQTNGSVYTVLHNFKRYDGAEPSNGTLTLSGSTLYGMTYTGGTHSYGTIYSVQTNGTGYTVLHNFMGTDGQQSNCSLIISGSTLYGMASWGGIFGYGVIFSIQTNGSAYTILHNFNDTTGGNPVGYLTLSGNTLYGVTNHGGANFLGTVFSIQTNGSGYTDMYDFKGSGTDGQNPVGGLVLSNTTLYGVASQSPSYGVIFSIQTNGSNFSTLFNNFGWDIVYTGMNPKNALTLNGNSLYGTTSIGGPYNDYGVVFSLSVPASVNEIVANSYKIKIYPNPNHGEFTLHVESEKVKGESVVEIYNMLGEKVYSRTFSIEHSTFNIDMNNHVTGIYFYRVLTEEGKLVGAGKFIVE